MVRKKFTQINFVKSVKFSTQITPKKGQMRCFHGVESDSNSLGGTILKATYNVAFNRKNSE